MAKITAPDNIQIAAMQEKKVLAAADAMTPGSGTPWEDIAEQGLFGAFFKSAFGVMFKPNKLLWQIRRPETTRETTWFVVGCGFFWAISIAIHATWLYLSTYRHFVQYAYTHPYQVDPTQYLINAGILAVAMIAATMLFWRMISVFFYKLTAFDMVGKVPKVLVTNVLGYTFAPSILAIIPFAGPPLAIAWIIALWAIAGYSRLHVKLAAVIIGAILTTVATAAIVTGVVFGVRFTWNSLGYSAFTIIEPPKLTQ